MIPVELKQAAHWCCWRMIDGSKKPFDPRSGRYASSNDINTFTDFETAEANRDKYDGIGIGVFERVCAIDIDHCYDLMTGLSDMASDIIRTMHSYTEVSPSGTGIRILFYADPADFDKSRFYVHNHKLGLEIYVAGATKKFVTVTGDYLSGDIGERGEELQTVLDKYMLRPITAEVAAEEGKSLLSDEQVLNKAMKLYKFTDLWNGGLGDSPSASEADLALCTSLAFWCRRDKEQIDRLFRKSPRMRDKWDAQRGPKTYGELTVNKACALQASIYDPTGLQQKPDLREDSVRMAQDFHPFDNPAYEWSEIGAAALFADWYKGLLAYVPEKKKWFSYDGRLWQAGNGENIEAMSLLNALADVLLVYAHGIAALAPEPEGKEKTPEELFLAYAKKWQTRRFRESVLKDARGNAMVSIDRFDSDPYKINLRNGTLDLREGTFHDHDPADLLTMVANVDYDPMATAHRWLRFTQEIMQGDAEKVLFLQKALGYALSGDISAECMFIFYGATTRNGKSTLAGTIAEMLGDYAKNCAPDTIAQKRGGNGGGGPSEDVARLRGARYVTVSEPDKRMALSTALIKSMTGGNVLTARSLNENSIQFRPQFKIFLDTNYLPTSTDTTLFDSGRVHVVPFNRHFTENEQDRGLKAELTEPESLSGILNWCLEGYRAFVAEGKRFYPPEAVRNATVQYREDNDRVSAFLLDELDRDGDCDAPLTEAYSRYKLWCDARGYRAENLSSFKVGVEKFAPVVKRRPRGTGRSATSVIVGYRLKTDTDSAFQDFNART